MVACGHSVGHGKSWGYADLGFRQSGSNTALAFAELQEWLIFALIDSTHYFLSVSGVRHWLPKR